MKARPRASRIMAAIFGIVAISAIVATCAAYVLARAFVRISSQLLAAYLGQLSSIVFLLAASDMMTAAVIWATQGMIPALGWSSARFLAWRGP